MATPTLAEQSVAVIIACYTEARWGLLMRAIAGVRAQTVHPDALLVVADHNEALYRRLAAELPDGVTAIRNSGARGAGGARNAGAQAVDTDYIAFLDDDVNPEPDWLAQLTAFVREPNVVGAGGGIFPEWASGEPAWFPRECGWVIGMRDAKQTSRVRNVWSASMAVERAAFAAAGGFLDAFGKVGTVSEPEDTELCIRLSRMTGRGWLFEPRARVSHYVPAEHATVHFFLRRCWMEGRGKAALRACSDGSASVLDDELRFLRSLPRACGSHLESALRGDRAGLARTALLLAGTATTCLAFLCSLTRHAPAWR